MYGVYTIIIKEIILEGMKIVDIKWVYKIKRNLDGSIKKYKARKVEHRFLQQYGINYDKTYVKIMRHST